jgi:hypothetical protein
MPVGRGRGKTESDRHMGRGEVNRQLGRQIGKFKEQTLAQMAPI